MKYSIRVEAAKDLENIWLYSRETWSIKQADRYFNLLLDEIENIANDPDSGQNYSEIRAGYFRSKVKSHFIFYKVNVESNVVEIIRILHQQMDVDARLNEE